MAIELPQPLLRGSVSARCIGDITRKREPDFENLFEPGQETLAHFYLPPFQRPPVWTDEQSARLIESLHLGISIGGIVVSGAGRIQANGRFAHTADWLIDGQQRLRAITRYLADDLVVFVGTPHEHRYSDLDRPQQRHFEDKPIGYTEIDEFDEHALRLIYDRLNFGGTAHTEDQRALPAD